MAMQNRSLDLFIKNQLSGRSNSTFGSPALNPDDRAVPNLVYSQEVLMSLGLSDVLFRFLWKTWGPHSP